MELTLEQALQKGIEAHKAGRVQEADKYYTSILQAQPKHPDANHNMGVLAVGVGKVEEALPFFKTALEANSSIAQYWLSYIDALIKLDRIAAAKSVFDQAKSNGAKGNGFDELEKRIETSRSKSSNNQEPCQEQQQSLVNLYRQGKHQEVLTHALQLLKQFPASFNLYNIIGASNQGLGKPGESIEAYKKALSIKPDYAEAYKNIGMVLQGIIFSKPNRDFQKTIVSLLDKKTFVRPRAIAIAAISLLKFEPSLQKHLQLVDNDIIENHVDVISDLNKIPLLLKLMSVCPLADLELEKLFKKLRYSVLSNISSLKEAPPKLLGFQSALELQCFTNEYVYNYSEEEEKILQALEKIVKKTLKNNEQPSPQIILVLASYKALNQYDWCNLLVVTDDIQEVFSRQVEEPNEEEKLKQDLPILKEITDGISSKVRAQYEESPYPRWVNLGLTIKPMSISKVVDKIRLK
ncbi:MAG: tetratricopeptide repeat protein, partial [Saprospiraceae bacterium]|nr:tetratricopeptide repeat protein [Saprospiraceae bacterium]